MEELGKPNLSDHFPLLKKLDLQGIRHHVTIFTDKIFETFDSLIDLRLRQRQEGYTESIDVLDTLLNMTEDKSVEIDINDIKHLFLDLFVAGGDTASSTLEWAVAELPYLKETFRLHPAAPLLLPRKASADVQVAGFIVPKDAQVLVNVWAIGRDEHSWDDPYSFTPERFLELDVDVKGRNFEIIPFGGGRRICPGLPLAIRMLHLMLGSLINSFDFKLEDDDVYMEEKFGFTLQMAKPLRVIPVPI